jgi:hypothetical protein
MIDSALASPTCTSRDRSAARELWCGIRDLVAMPGGALSAGNTRLVAAAAAVLIAAVTRNLLLTIASGFAVLWLLT